MRRIGLAVILALILIAPLVAGAQQAGIVYRLGVLRAGDNTRPGDSVDIAIREGLQPLGFVVGRNLTIEYRSAEGRYDRLPDLVAELIGLRMDVILATDHDRAGCQEQDKRDSLGLHGGPRPGRHRARRESFTARRKRNWHNEQCP